MKHRSFLAVLFITLVLAGCDQEGAPVFAPTRSPGPEPPFYPLAVGNEWTYDLSLVVVHTDLDTHAEVRRDTTLAVEESRLATTETLDGTDYVVEQVSTQGVESPPPDPEMTWVRLRQDSTGLHRANVSTHQPPGAAGSLSRAAGQEITERLQLKYPLGVDSTWVVDSLTAVTAEVEALEQITVPAGSFETYRIRIRTPLQGPHDWLRIWYAKEGRVRRAAHTEFDVTDIISGRRFRIVGDELEEASDVRLIEP